MSFFVRIPQVVTKASRVADKTTGEFRLEQLVQIIHPTQFTPVQASILLQIGQTPYGVGDYEMAPESIQAGQYGRPEFRLVVGSPITAATKKAA